MPRGAKLGNQYSKGKNLGTHNAMWKGDGVSRSQLRQWVRYHLPKPEFCEVCGVKPPYDLVNKTGVYNRGLINWYYSCRRCHMLNDGRMKNLNPMAAKGKHHSDEARENIALGKLGIRNPAWKGDHVGRGALHKWLKENWPTSFPELCEECNIRKARDLTNISPNYNPDTYNRDFKNWRWLCSKCHTLTDGRVERLIKIGFGGRR